VRENIGYERYIRPFPAPVRPVLLRERLLKPWRHSKVGQRRPASGSRKSRSNGSGIEAGITVP